jgi:tetratricopeptide (TPR) repeat protein
VSSAESLPIIRRALDYWLVFIQELKGSPDHSLLNEHDNILRAVKLGLGAEATRRQAMQLALAAFLPVESAGLWPAWTPLLEKIYGRFCDTDRTLYARFLGRLGQCYRLHSRLDEALVIHREAAALIAALPSDKLLICEIAFQLAESYRRKFQYEQARQQGLIAWEAAEAGQQSDAWRAAIASSLGLTCEALGQLDEAAHWYTTSVGLWRPLQRPVEFARAHSNLGNVLQRQGQMDDALLAYHQALRQLEGTSAWLEKLIVQYNIAVVYFYQQQYAAAEPVLREVYATLARQPDMHFVLYASICHSLGSVIAKQERFAETEPFFEESIAIWRKLGDDVSTANGLGGLAEALANQGQADAARHSYSQALALLANQRDIPWGEKLYPEFSAAYAALGECVEPVPR